MEVYLLTEVTYDYYAFPEVYGIFSSVERAREFISKLKHKYNSEYPIYDFTDDSIDIDSTIEALCKSEKSHWEITKYILNNGVIRDKCYWQTNIDKL